MQRPHSWIGGRLLVGCALGMALWACAVAGRAAVDSPAAAVAELHMSLPPSGTRTFGGQPSTHPTPWVQADRSDQPSDSEPGLFGRSSPMALQRQAAEPRWIAAAPAEFSVAVIDPVTALLNELRRALLSAVRPFAPSLIRETLSVISKLPPSQRAAATRMLIKLAMKPRPIFQVESAEDGEEEQVRFSQCDPLAGGFGWPLRLLFSCRACCALCVAQWSTFARPPLVCPGDLRLTVDGSCWPIPYLRAALRYRQALRAARRCARSLGLEADDVFAQCFDFPAVRSARRAMRHELGKLPPFVVLPVRKWTL